MAEDRAHNCCAVTREERGRLHEAPAYRWSVYLALIRTTSLVVVPRETARRPSRDQSPANTTGELSPVANVSWRSGPPPGDRAEDVQNAVPTRRLVSPATLHAV